MLYNIHAHCPWLSDNRLNQIIRSLGHRSRVVDDSFAQQTAGLFTGQRLAVNYSGWKRFQSHAAQATSNKELKDGSQFVVCLFNKAREADSGKMGKLHRLAFER